MAQGIAGIPRLSRGRRALARRALGYLAFLPIASRASVYARLIFDLVRDPRIPRGRKALLAAALGYLVVGRDLVPDDLPVIGGLDDLVVVVVAVDLFLDGVPAAVLDEKLTELGIERAAFDRDVAQIRRLTPGPVRRAIRRLPRLAGAARDAFIKTGFGPRLRAWISKEGSVA